MRVSRRALSVLWPYMHRGLGVSVGQFGIHLGSSASWWTTPYATFCGAMLLIAFSRKSLLIWITGIWGLWTCAIGLVDTLPQLLIVRVLSSVGLGVFTPAAFSLTGDLFDSRERGRAIGLMRAVGIIGTVAAFGVLPVLAARGPEAWRTGFVVMGGASVITGLLMVFLPEPPRGRKLNRNCATSSQTRALAVRPPIQPGVRPILRTCGRLWRTGVGGFLLLNEFALLHRCEHLSKLGLYLARWSWLGWVSLFTHHGRVGWLGEWVYLLWLAWRSFGVSRGAGNRNVDWIDNIGPHPRLRSSQRLVAAICQD